MDQAPGGFAFLFGQSSIVPSPSLLSAADEANFNCPDGQAGAAGHRFDERVGRLGLPLRLVDTERSLAPRQPAGVLRPDAESRGLAVLRFWSLLPEILGRGSGRFCRHSR